MNYKNIEIAALSAPEIHELLDLGNTVNIVDMIEDLSEVIEILSNVESCPHGIISTVARTQRLLIDICRLK